ncbi:MAG: hypothetical protein FJW96_10895, partial [Actinobacteria bacterium]|nr:hypothetical protein [Actinomycetota bacterium]
MTSADIARELRAARPVAPETLRTRVAEIVAVEPDPQPSFGARLAALRTRPRRTLMVLVPATAVAA